MITEQLWELDVQFASWFILTSPATSGVKHPCASRVLLPCGAHTTVCEDKRWLAALPTASRPLNGTSVLECVGVLAMVLLAPPVSSVRTVTRSTNISILSSVCLSHRCGTLCPS